MKRIGVKKVPDDVFPAPEPWVCGRAWTASAITIIHCGKHYYRKQETVFLGQCPKFQDSPSPKVLYLRDLFRTVSLKIGPFCLQDWDFGSERLFQFCFGQFYIKVYFGPGFSEQEIWD